LGYGSIRQETQDINSNYNSGQLSLEKRFTQGTLLHDLTLFANYTYSKTIDTLPVGAGVENIGISTVSFYSVNRRSLDRGPSDFDHTHRMVLSYDWLLPRLGGASRWLRGVAGNWELTGILTAQSGDPITIVAGQDRSQTGLGADRGVIVGPAFGGGACKNNAPCVDYLSPGSFQLPALGTFGDIGRNSLRGPNLVDWDMGFFKNFPVGDRFRIQLRVEFFNIFNRVSFGDPNTTVSAGGFGRITSANDPRISQMALKLSF
jgi:hypothetical protein